MQRPNSVLVLGIYPIVLLVFMYRKNVVEFFASLRSASPAV